MLVNCYNIVKNLPVIQNKLCNRVCCFLIQVKLLEFLVSFKCLLTNLLFFIFFITIAIKKNSHKAVKAKVFIFNYFQNLMTLGVGVFLITLNLVYVVLSVVDFMSNSLRVVVSFQC